MFLISVLAAYRQLGAGNDKELLGVIFHHLGHTFIN